MKTQQPPQQPQQQPLQTPSKGPSRGASGKSVLETVQENSADDVKPSPAAIKAAADLKPLTKLNEDDGGKAGKGDGEGETQSLHGESGSESAGAKVDKKKDTESIATRPKNGTTKSYASLASSKSRQAEGKQNMTVETETVQSIPQSAIAAGDRSGGTRNDNSGSVRLKPSNETIRPKKERKKTTQKARSINQGTGEYFALPPVALRLLAAASRVHLSGEGCYVSQESISMSKKDRRGSCRTSSMPVSIFAQSNLFTLKIL